MEEEFSFHIYIGRNFYTKFLLSYSFFVLFVSINNALLQPYFVREKRMNTFFGNIFVVFYMKHFMLSNTQENFSNILNGNKDYFSIQLTFPINVYTT